MANNITAQEYLTKSETNLRSFKREWESFTSEVPDKLMSLIRSGIRPSVSSSRSGNQIGVTLNFESNMDAAKKYIEQVKEKMEKKSDEIKKIFHLRVCQKILKQLIAEREMRSSISLFAKTLVF